MLEMVWSYKRGMALTAQFESRIKVAAVVGCEEKEWGGGEKEKEREREREREKTFHLSYLAWIKIVPSKTPFLGCSQAKVRETRVRKGKGHEGEKRKGGGG